MPMQDFFARHDVPNDIRKRVVTQMLARHTNRRMMRDELLLRDMTPSMRVRQGGCSLHCDRMWVASGRLCGLMGQRWTWGRARCVSFISQKVGVGLRGTAVCPSNRCSSTTRPPKTVHRQLLMNS